MWRLRRRRFWAISATGLAVAALPFLLDGSGLFADASMTLFTVRLFATIALPFVLLALFDPHLPPFVTLLLYAVLVVVDGLTILGATAGDGASAVIGYLMLPFYGLAIVAAGVFATFVSRHVARRLEHGPRNEPPAGRY